MEDGKRTTCTNKLSKIILLFLFLSLSGLALLLHNISSVENLNCHTVSALYQLQTRLQSSMTAGLPTFHHNLTYCAQLGQKPTAEDELEDQYLQHLLSWPLFPSRSGGPLPLRFTSDPVHSMFTILPTKRGTEWHVGDQLEALVQMHDFQGRPKHYGGDFLLARLHTPEIGASVAGVVLDHKNGFYSALFPLLWEGPAIVEITMVHSSEAVAVLKRLQDERPDRVFFKSLFRLGLLSETTVCNMCLPKEQRPLCNFTDPHTGEPWFCYKPKVLGCDTRVNHAKGGYLKHIISDKEALLFQSGVNLKVYIGSSGTNKVTVLPFSKDEADSGSVYPEQFKASPSGYYYEDSWRPFGDINMRQFSNAAAVTQCLSNKIIYMFGDSTARQWFEYLTSFTPDLKEFNLSSPKNVGPYMAVDSDNNILLKYRCHGPPIRFSTVLSSELRYVANELDGLSGGPNTVVVLSVWSHFSTFPTEVYIRRLRHIRRALVRLMGRAPGTMVVIRSANLQAQEEEVSLYNSDWFSLQQDTVIKSMFKGLDVLLVDAWEMTLAHHLPHHLHPPPEIIKNMIDMLLSYICP
ncbi:NXPE family member 3 [Synchiropus splendidus]|uniref:NXPE family member 3 n=1 Tax=Synchiropus splendidus TaxID=270530 RepID=UPI00237DA911|nr:NXPE family member 3 [Synchiropus splendidus]